MRRVDKTWTVAVTGAAGHVGGRLVPALEERGHAVRALTRDDGDVGDRAAMLAALDGVDAAYYLVHSLATSGEFAVDERRDAREFAAAARERGVERLIYLGGIVHDENGLSPHLQSRREVGEIFRASGVPTIEFRASIVVGEGSASFELVKTMVERVPSPVAPDWLDHAAQPIAIEDVVEYLAAALDLELDGDAVYEIGGADVVRYRDLVNEVAEQVGGTKRLLTLPVPNLPIPVPDALPDRAKVALHLLESLRHDTDVRDDAALRDFTVRPRGLKRAVAEALATVEG
jgi:uncharacterized protein YbjT (DUF2867 family)